MTIGKIKPRKPAIGSIRLLAVVSVVLLLFAVIGTLAFDVRNRLAALERADSDNGQWVMMQTEVEVLRLHDAIGAAQSGEMTLADVRRWFDVLYSRLSMLRQSPLYSDFIGMPENSRQLDKMQAYINRWLPVIDGPDDELSRSLAQMRAENAEVQRLARALSLNALLSFSAHTDETRAHVSETLVRLAITTAATLVLLGLLAAMATRLYSLTEEQAKQNRTSSARLQMIIATSPDAIVVTNRGGWVVEFNPVAEAMFGVTRDQVMGRQIMPIIFSPDYLKQYQSQMDALVSAAVSQGPQRFEMQARRADGTEFPVEISLAIRDQKQGSLIVGFLRDVSERNSDRLALEHALQQAQSGEKAKAEFLAVMSHEMRTPLNGLIGSMELMHDTPLSESQQELLRVMEVSGEILLGHVNSVLDISRTEAGEIRLADTPFNLDRLIEDCIANQAGVAKTGGNVIRHVALSGALGTVRGDPGRLQQIMLNLIGNAVKFTRNGTITVESERLPPTKGQRNGHMIEFRVIDTGIGISETDIQRVFEDFETVDSSYGREVSGTGLGLGIARRLTLAMGGSIGVESELGAGSVFWLRLPLPSAEPMPEPAPLAKVQHVAVKTSEPMKILVIEDNEINRFLLRRFLQDAEHQVVEAADGIEGVAAAEQTRFDLIITDISMPRLDGIEATRRIRAGGASSQARIVALTAHALPEDLERFRKAGMDACLTKPVTREVLMAQLHSNTSTIGSLPGPANGKPVIDPAPLQELAEELGKPMVATLMKRMLADGDDTIARIGAEHGPTDEVARIAHQLAGSCATFGALPLREALAEIEISIKRGDGTAAQAHMAGLPDLWAATRAELESYAQALVA